MENYTVYMHVTPNNKKYIGITCKSPAHRWANGNGYKKNVLFYRAIIKYGWDNIQHLIIANGLSKEEACSMEVELIKKHNTTNPKHGYNVSTGGESGTSGVRYGPEFCKKVHDRMMGPGNPTRGKKFSEETRKKLSEARKGKWSDRQRVALTKVHESIRKQVICVETREVYESAKDAAYKNGVSERCIRDACRGRQKRSNGFHWEYYSIGKDYEIKDFPVYCIETKVAYASSKEAARRFSVDLYEFCACIGKKKTVIQGRHWKVFNENKDDYVMYVR